MPEHTAEQAIAERYLDEMLEAERTRDFAAWCRRWYRGEVVGLTDEIYQSDLDQMERVLGAYRHRECLGVVRGRLDTADDKRPARRLRFVFRMIFEKNEALNIVGLQEIDGVWYAYENACNLG